MRHHFKCAAIAVVTLLLLSCQQFTPERSYNGGINVIPTPNSMEEKLGEKSFKLTKSTTVTANGEQAQKIADFVFDQMALATGFNNKMVAKDGDISLSIDSSIASQPESYTLEVSPTNIKIVGYDAAGLFYGMQTLLQLLPAEITSPKVVKNISWEIPSLSIKDAPRFAYRGIMLDVCRHFMPAEMVKKQIDILSMFKINRLHWHLTEDQAWRVEIKKYPLLTEIGSKRIEGEGFEYSGFYTQDEIREVVAYAAERHVTIIPEFELPGHELAAIAAYPHLSCSGEPTSPRIIWGVEDVVMCPGKQSTFDFIEDIIEEMTALFPGEYFHVGGDECPKTSWSKCPACQAFIKENGLQAKDGHSAEERLQSYIIGQAEKMLSARGKKLIGWDEILEGGLSSGATVMAWRGESGGIAAANQGHNVIMTPNSGGMYFDQYQGDFRIEPVTIGGLSTLERVYSYDPIPAELVQSGKDDFIMGVQANMWSEYQYTQDLFEYRLYPRALAVAEIGWSELERKDFEDLSRRVNNGYVRLDNHDANYHIPMPEQPIESTNYVAFTDQTTVEFKTTRPIKMVYTLNGEEPTANSTEYTQPLTFTESATLKICSVLPSGVISDVRHIEVVKQEYSAATTLTDAKQGLLMRTIPGNYLNRAELAASTERGSVKVINALQQLVIRETFRSSLRNTQQAATIAEGYIDIAEDGVYHFWTNNNELWIDGELIVDNDNQVKRFSRSGRSKALAKGMHSIKIVWLGNIIGGWPTNWDNGEVKIRKDGSKESVSLSKKHLFYQEN